MANDVECPYCGAEEEINHDDGYGYEENEKHEQTCGECDKVFTYTTSISYYYEAEKADCLNGEPHIMKPVISSATNIFPDWKRCETCEHEDRGKYVPLKEETP